MYMYRSNLYTDMLKLYEKNYDYNINSENTIKNLQATKMYRLHLPQFLYLQLKIVNKKIGVNSGCKF